MDNCKAAILRQLTAEYRKLLETVSFAELEEIRFRIGRPVMLYRHNGYDYLSASGGATKIINQAKIVKKADLDDLSAALCANSVYAYLSEIKDGFITLRGGHRVGLAGKCIIKNGEITNISAISGINIRIAKAYTGCGDRLATLLRTQTSVKNTLLISPPQCGKTTLLRDLARIFSANFKVCIVDERSEIAGSFEGLPQFDIGPQTDVLDRFPKADGIILAIRSLSPQILITDELGTKAETEALQSASQAGCRLLTSVHGDNLDSVKKTRPEFLNFFDTAVILGRKNNCPAIVDVINLR